MVCVRLASLAVTKSQASNTSDCDTPTFPSAAKMSGMRAACFMPIAWSCTGGDRGRAGGLGGRAAGERLEGLRDCDGVAMGAREAGHRAA